LAAALNDPERTVIEQVAVAGAFLAVPVPQAADNVP
jgi:hypothetical protein